MTRRTVVLLVILGVVWAIAFLFLSRGQEPSLVSETPREDLIGTLANTFVRPDLKEVALRTVENSVFLFQTVALAFDRDEADKLILALPRVGEYKFLGFIRSKEGIKIILLKDGTKLEITGETPNFGDYTVAYASSLGLIVLDTRSGAFYSIR